MWETIPIATIRIIWKRNTAKMTILVDANVVLDVLLDRAPFAEPAAALWAKIEADEVRAYLTSTTVTTIFYIVRKALGLPMAWQVLDDLLRVFEICPVDRGVLVLAPARPMSDFEDAVQDAAAELAGIPTLITRNLRDFANSNCQVLDAESFLRDS